MPITQQELSRRIRAAREASRMTQGEVAVLLGISRPSYVQIEQGRRSVSSLELDGLAHAFGRDIHELIHGDFQDEDPLAALFRTHPEMAGHPEFLNALRECVVLGRELSRLERFLGLDRDVEGIAGCSWPQPESRWEAIRQGQSMAESERRRLALGDRALPEVTELLEAQGVRTALMDLPEDVAGLTLNHGRIGFFVVANRQHHHLRRRFSFVHEYAHVLADQDRLGQVSRGSERNDLLEVRANAFAACFLMPEDGVCRFLRGLGKGKRSRPSASVFDEAGIVEAEGRIEPGSQDLQLYDIVQLAHHFGVSCASAIYRLKNLRMLTAREFDHLKAMEEAGRARQLSSFLGLPEPDHTELRNAFKRRFLGLALEAHRREEISRGKLRELAAMVGCSPADLEGVEDGMAGLLPGNGGGS